MITLEEKIEQYLIDYQIIENLLQKNTYLLTIRKEYSDEFILHMIDLCHKMGSTGETWLKSYSFHVVGLFIGIQGYNRGILEVPHITWMKFKVKDKELIDAWVKQMLDHTHTLRNIAI